MKGSVLKELIVYSYRNVKDKKSSSFPYFLITFLCKQT